MISNRHRLSLACSEITDTLHFLTFDKDDPSCGKKMKFSWTVVPIDRQNLIQENIIITTFVQKLEHSKHYYLCISGLIDGIYTAVACPRPSFFQTIQRNTQQKKKLQTIIISLKKNRNPDVRVKTIEVFSLFVLSIKREIVTPSAPRQLETSFSSTGSRNTPALRGRRLLSRTR